MENPYEVYEKYILRSPMFSIGSFKNFTSKKILSKDDFRTLCCNPIFSEALFLASPSFYKEVQKWLDDESETKNEKLKFSILKYFSRMSSRCTPFGLFAGCTIGEFGDKTDVKLKKSSKYERHTRLDMNYLVALSQNLSENEDIKKQLIFYPNTSIYKVGDKIRYVEYYYKNGVRIHDIVSVNWSEPLQKIIDTAINGSSLIDLANIIIDNEISLNDAFHFIEELIINQILVSELEPSVSGPEFFEQIFPVLKKIPGIDHINSILSDTHIRLKKIDTVIGNSPKRYIEISNNLEALNTNFDLKYLFQTDLILKTSKNKLDQNIIQKLKKALNILNKITFPFPTSNLTKFREAFYERFENREIPLLKVLDVEMGIGYKQGEGSNDINPLIDDLFIPISHSKNSYRDIKWNNIYTILEKKLKEAYKYNLFTITLSDDDLINFDSSWDDIPNTLSAVIEIVNIDGEENIKFSGAGGSSAANLMARFCHGDEELYSYVQQIIKDETRMDEDKIVAEIVHLPESRVGNILMRPELRKFEIPYLAKSCKNSDFQIPLDDLLISVRGSKILLKSKKYNKEVIPRLTNAHNFSNNSLPIYQFLCDMQSQNIRNGIGFNFGPFANEYTFLPRVKYKNIIFQEAVWNLKKEDVEHFLDNNDNKLLIKVSDFRTTMQMPQYVMLVDRDNELLINLNNITSIRMLLDTINKRDSFILKEFLFDKNGIVQNKEYYTNQFVISFYNSEKLINNKDLDE